MTIYSRWGQRVYAEDSPQKGWNGESLGQPCSEGVYYYVIKYYNPMVKTVQEKGGGCYLIALIMHRKLNPKKWMCAKIFLQF
jgi:hypothetical protein